MKRFSLELDKMDSPTIVNELLHKVTYQTGLGYSIFSPSHMVSWTLVCIKNWH